MDDRDGFLPEAAPTTGETPESWVAPAETPPEDGVERGAKVAAFALAGLYAGGFVLAPLASLAATGGPAAALPFLFWWGVLGCPVLGACALALTICLVRRYLNRD